MTSVIKASEKLRKMREKVQEELDHIPRGTFEQNMFRQYYSSFRMNSLGRKAKFPDSKEVVLNACLESFKKRYPDFRPVYDRNFFAKRGARMQ